jgi:quercetin dioxygenase-like cupin family protein
MPSQTRLDALTAAPQHHRLLFENDSVRVLDTRIEPGQTVPLHTHRWPAAHYILVPGEFVRRDEHGAVTLDTRKTPVNHRAGDAVWSGPLGPHTLENVGETTIHIVSVEVKGP